MIALPFVIPAIFKTLGGFLRSIPWPVWFGLALLTTFLWYGHLRYEAGQAEVQARWDAEKAQVRAFNEAMRQRGLELRKKQKAAVKMIKVDIKKGLGDAKQKAVAVRDDVRAGRVQLRDHWACPAVPAPAGPAGGAAAAAELRAADTGALVEIGAEADTLIEACARQLNADRGKFE